MRYNGTRNGLCAVLLAGASIVAFAGGASAAATVSRFVFNPNPIGTEATVVPGSTVPITLTAEDSTGTPVAGGTIYLTFGTGNSGGGRAMVGAIVLKPKPRAFVTDAGGQVVITYTAPSTFPSTGCDVLKAMNGPNVGSSTTSATDTVCFSPITVLVVSPFPIAASGSLAANTQVTVMLTARGANGPLANVTVWLTFSSASPSDGARATVNGAALSRTPTSEMTDATGHVIVVYSTGSTLLAVGTDRLIARTEPAFPTVQVGDPYKY